RARTAHRGRRRHRRLVRVAAVPDVAGRRPASAGARRGAPVECAAVRSRRLYARDRRGRADAGRTGPSVAAQPEKGACAARRRAGSVRGPPRGGDRLMEAVYSAAIGVLAGAGVWLLLRPRTFQVIIGLALLSY